jgi:hypothetical protein
MPRYRQLPITIEAIQWTGDNFSEIKKFCISAHQSGYKDNDSILIVNQHSYHEYVNQKDWIIFTDFGGFSCVRFEVFEKTYEKIEEN